MFVLFTTIAFSQEVRIGYPESQIREEFKYDGIKKDYMTLEGETIAYLLLEDDEMTIMYLLDDNGYSPNNIVVPKTRSMHTILYNEFNEKYEIVDENMWKWYIDSGVVIIKLIYDDAYGSFWFIQG